MSSRHHPSGQPASPWAQIFYASKDPFWYTRGDGLAHSGLAPEFPALTRDDLGDGRIPHKVEPKPSPAGLDRLFYGERQQKEALGGLMTWQMGALREAFYTFEQATQSDRRCLDDLTIDEATWLPCFQKDRWLDHASSIRQHLRNPIAGLLAAHPTDRMTVDNSLVWGEIRFCTELANRILEQLILSRNCLLDAILFGDRLDWAALDAAVMATFFGRDDYPPIVVFQRPPDLVASSEALRTRLDELSQDVLWGFIDDDGQSQNGCTIGLSVEIHAAQVFETVPPDPSKHGGRTSQNGAFLHVALLRSLWEADTPLVERCAARLQTAVTMVHELMHCLARAKEPLLPHEPYIFPYAHRELGRVAEMAAFGQQLAWTPMLYHPDIIGSGASTVMLAAKWPPGKEVLKWPLQYQSPVNFEDRCRYSIPSEWTTALQSQPYWLDVVSRWGTRALHPPHIFRSYTESPTGYIGHRYRGAFPIQLRDVPTDMESLYLKAIQRWRRQYVTQKSNRPWWEAESMKWDRTPWSWATARETISQFREYHRKRDLARCIQCINTLWSHHGDDKTLWNHPTTWLFRCICHLMMTSIPMPQGPLSRQGRCLRISGIPSQQAALRLNYHGEFRALENNSPRAEDVTVTTWPFIPDTFTSLYNFYALFSVAARQWSQPWIWLDTCIRTFRDLSRDSGVYLGPDAWLPFNFSIPDYVEITEWALIESETEGFTRPGQFPIVTYGAIPPPLSNAGRFVSPLHTPPSLPIQLPDASVPPPRYEPLPGAWGGAPTSQPVASRYFTVGIVGNHMYGDSFWVVEPDGAHGYDIFRISKKCQELGYHTADHIRRELVTVGPLGPSLLKDGHPHAEAIRREFRHSLHPIGKLLVRKKLEAIAEHNGQHDMPLWIIIGSDVYDITEFPFEGDEEENQLRSSPGGVPKTLPASNDDHARLLDRLLPFKCALVDGTRGSKKPVLEPYTPAMLRWHDNPSDGMYTAINGIVYDITGYYESHPGGSDILMGDLGKESTEFFKHHDAELMDDYADLALGRLVPEIPAGRLGRHQIALQGWVYDLSGLNRDEHWFLAAVQRLGGQDASAALAGEGVDAITASALAHLVEHERGRIAGGVAAAAVPRGEEGPTIPSGELARHRDPQRVHGGWVAVDGRVYDLTAVMRHGARFYGRDVPWYWAGREVTDPDLGRWIRATLAHRVVGRLVDGEPWPAGFSGGAEGDDIGAGKRKRSPSPDCVDGERRAKCKAN